MQTNEKCKNFSWRNISFMVIFLSILMLFVFNLFIFLGYTETSSCLCDCFSILGNYEEVLSIEGKKLNCEKPKGGCCNECNYEYYPVCKNSWHIPYTGYAIYLDSEFVIKKMYYEKGKARSDSTKFYTHDGRLCYIDRDNMTANCVTYEDGKVVEKSSENLRE